MPTPAGPRNCYRVPARPGVRYIPGFRLGYAALPAGHQHHRHLRHLPGENLRRHGQLVLFTVIPAAFVGPVPAELVHDFSWRTLAELLAAALVLVALAPTGFGRGLRRFESGSSIPAQT